MIITARRQQRVLAALHSSLRDSDPRLVARFATFTQLTADEKIPGIERVRAWPVGWLGTGGRLIARHFSSPGQRPGTAGPWLRGVVFVPLAAVLIVVALLLARGGAQARCVPTRAGGQHTAPATAVPLPGVVGCTPGQVPGSGH